MPCVELILRKISVEHSRPYRSIPVRRTRLSGSSDLTAGQSKKSYLSMPTQTAELLISPNFIHYLDVKNATILSSFSIDQIEKLTLIDRSPNSICFCFALEKGEQSYLIETDLFTGFTDLFNLMVDHGKEISYLSP